MGEGKTCKLNGQVLLSKCKDGTEKANLLHYLIRGVHQRSGLRGRTSTALDHLLVSPVCAMKPEAGFTRADLYRSGPHVGTTSLQKGETHSILSSGNLQLSPRKACTFLAGVELPPWRFLSVVGGECALDVPIQHHPASPRELAGPSSAQEMFHAQIA